MNILSILSNMWLMILIGALPLLSESIYSTCLSEIASDLNIVPSTIEYTLSIYLFGFSFGILFWGRVSDYYGRKICLLLGYSIFIISCIFCYYTKTISILMISRFIQGFGNSVGSVLPQVIYRDLFPNKKSLQKIYSITTAVLFIFSTVGPFIGAIIINYLYWKDIFIIFILIALIINILIIIYFKETIKQINHHSLFYIIYQLISDKYVIGCTLISGICNGIYFSYFAESSFYLMNLLKLTHLEYSLTFIIITIGSILGGIYSKKINEIYSSDQILNHGIKFMIFSCLFYIVTIIIHENYIKLHIYILLGNILLSITMLNFGSTIVVSNTLALALLNYQWCIGTASSIFGFAYYIIASIITIGIGYFHNETLIFMPMYFFFLCILILIINKCGHYRI